MAFADYESAAQLPKQTKVDTIAGKFWEFHAANPHVYLKIGEIVSFIAERSKRRWGIGAIFERLRWVSEFETVGDEYKLNNNFRAYYVRMLIKDQPNLADVFELRKSEADLEFPEKKAHA